MFLLWFQSVLQKSFGVPPQGTCHWLMRWRRFAMLDHKLGLVLFSGKVHISTLSWRSGRGWLVLYRETSLVYVPPSCLGSGCFFLPLRSQSSSWLQWVGECLFHFLYPPPCYEPPSLFCLSTCVQQSWETGSLFFICFNVLSIWYFFLLLKD